MTERIFTNRKISKWQFDTAILRSLGPSSKSYQYLKIRWCKLVEITWRQLVLIKLENAYQSIVMKKENNNKQRNALVYKDYTFNS